VTGISLGEYRDPTRRFLPGGNFPAKAVILVSLWPKLDVPLLAFTPRSGDAPGFEAFNFMTPGIEFRLLLGDNVPAPLRASCSHGSTRRCIFSASSLLTETRQTFLNLARESKVSGSLKGNWPSPLKTRRLSHPDFPQMRPRGAVPANTDSGAA
jgi:hypothetical protein